MDDIGGLFFHGRTRPTSCSDGREEQQDP